MNYLNFLYFIVIYNITRSVRGFEPPSLTAALEAFTVTPTTRKALWTFLSGTVVFICTILSDS